MTVQEAYTQLKFLVDKNMTNASQSLDLARFVLVYNTAQNKYVRRVLDKRNEDEIRSIQKLLITDKRLKLKNKELGSELFSLPSDFFDFSNVQAYASNGNCARAKIQVFEVKQENTEELLANEYYKPSFSYRESFYNLSEDAVKLYTDGFSFSDVRLTYYRYPLQVDIEGYTHIDGTMSHNVNPELDDKVVEQILLIAAKDFHANNDDINNMQKDTQRINTNY